MMKKVALHNLGCRVNEYETEEMARALASRGFKIVPFDAAADVYIVNTCTVTNIADRKSRQMLRRARKTNPDALVIAVGCYVDTHKDIGGEEGLIDAAFPNAEKARIAEHIESLLAFEGGDGVCGPEEDYLAGLEHTRSCLKIEDGCNAFCSYCIIPYARGRVTSKPLGAILEEAREMAAKGHREIVLTGIHLSAYGTDRKDAGDEPLFEVVRRIAEIPGIDRIRFGSLEPRIMTEKMLSSLRTIPQVCPQFHLSLQSGSDSVLRRMNRHYTADDYRRIVQRIRAFYPGAAVTTDIIAGFPGETEKEFAETEQFIREMKFAKTHIFRYSKREGTAAARMDGQIPEREKEKRSALLIEAGKEGERTYLAGFCGRTAEVLFEEKVNTREGSMWQGHTMENVSVRVRSEEELSGRLLRCRITAAEDELLYGCVEGEG